MFFHHSWQKGDGVSLGESVLTVKFFAGWIGTLGAIDLQWFTKCMVSMDNMM